MRIAPQSAPMTVTRGLIALNVAVFGLMLLQGVHPLQPAIADLLRWGANYGPKTTQGAWWRLVTCMFLHIGVIHLLFNMVALWSVGDLMEQLLGRAGFVVLYGLSGVFSSIVSVAWHPTVVSAGASGAIFGVYGGLLAFVMRHRDMQQQAFLAALRTNTLAFLGYNLVFGLFQQGIDMAAHVGGLVGGFGCGFVLTPPLPQRQRMTQHQRSALVGLLGLGLLGGLVTFLPQVEDVETKFQRFAELDSATLTAFNHAITDLQAGRLTEGELMRLVQQDLLPPWRRQFTEFQQLATLSRLTSRQRQLLALLLRYMSARQEGWELLYAGLRTRDTPLLKQASEKQQQADAILREHNARGGKP